MPTVRGEPFETFYARQRRPLVGLAYAVSGSRLAAEDLAQEALLAAYRDWDRIRRLEEPEAWVRRMVLNRAVSAYRRRMAEVKALTRLGGRRDSSPFPDVTGEIDLIWTEVRRLPKRQVQVIALRYVEQLTMAEIGTILGCSKETVNTHLRRARRALIPRNRPYQRPVLTISRRAMMRLLPTRSVLAVCLLAVTGMSCSTTESTDTVGSPTVNNLPVTHSEVHETPYDSVASLTDASDLVIVGEVVDVKSVGTPDEGEDPHASEYFMVSVRPEKTMKGTAPSTVTIAWEGFITDGSGNRTLRVERNGVGMPEVGRRVLLHLLEETRERSDFFGGEISHQLNTLDGILFVGTDGRLTTPLHGENRPAHQLAGTKVNEIGSLSEASG